MNCIRMSMRNMRRTLITALAVAASLTLAGAADKLKPEEIIKRFAAKETEFKDVWNQYTYNQQIVFQVLNTSGKVREQREMWVEVYFTTSGKRRTRVLEDHGELRSVGVTREDMDDAIHRQPFVLTTEELPSYKVDYHGEERVDELDTYVFDVKPRKMEKGQRYFKGRLWVDNVDFQIVMSRGKVVPDSSQNKFPEFETIRQQVDGEYWFPTWTEADDVLSFGNAFSGRRDVRIRELITYQDFKKFEVNATIKYEPIEKDESDEPEEQP